MSMQLTPEERERQILDNMNLVYHLIKHLPYVNPSNYDDVVQIGRIGLIKAVSTFDDTKGIKFGTYASTCINNEIYMHFRKEKQHNSDVSLNDIIYTDDEGNDVELEDVLGNGEDFVDEIIDEEITIKALDIILNMLEPKEAIIMLYKISGIYSQEEIGKNVGLTQTAISRAKERAAQKIRKYLEIEEKPYYTTWSIFSIGKIGTFYKFGCNIEQFNECLEKFLQDDKVTILLDYKIIRNNGRTQLLMPSCPETFAFIAEILKEIFGF